MYVTIEDKIRAYLFRGKTVSRMINMDFGTEDLCTMPDSWHRIIDNHMEVR